MLGLYTRLPGLSPEASIALREEQLGRTIRIHHAFYNWTDPFPGPQQEDDANHGRIPLITWWGTEYARINDGSQDALIRARADALRDYGHPVMLAWAAEMNLDYPPWPDVRQPSDPAGFIAAWRHIHAIFDEEGATNVSWVWTPNSESHPGGTDPKSPNNWTRYYPGDAYVDWVGIDGYNWGDVGFARWRSFASYVGPIYRDYAGRKPIAIVETASNDVGGDKSAWLDAARVWMKSHPAIEAFVWFDQRSDASHDWRIDSSPGSMVAFKALAADPVFNK